MLVDQQIDESSDNQEMDGEASGSEDDFESEVHDPNVLAEQFDFDEVPSDEEDGQDQDQDEIAHVPRAPRFGRCSAIIEPTILKKIKIWDRPVKTRLPYRLVELEDEFRANGVMIDEERIMVVHVSLLAEPN